MLERLRNATDKALSSRVSPLAYLAACVSWVVGFFFVFFQFVPDIKNSVLYERVLFGESRPWGAGLLIMSTLLIAGMRLRNRAWCKFGAMGNFSFWTFAAIIYIRHDYWFAFFTFALFHMICQGYFYLVAALDRLWHQRVDYS